MDHYDEKMNYSFEPVAPETPQPPLEQAKEEIRRSGKHTGLKIAALLAAVAIVAGVGGSALTKAIDAIGQKNLAEQESSASVGAMAEQSVEQEQPAVHSAIDKKLLCANLQPRCEVLGEIPEQLDFFDAMPEYDVSLYANKKQKTTPETAKEALEALLPVLSDEALDFANRDAVFDACKAKAEELGKKNGWLLYPLGIALSGKARTPGGGTDLAAMMGKEETLRRLNAAIEAL